jgi:hypothetical protein
MSTACLVVVYTLPLNTALPFMEMVVNTLSTACLHLSTPFMEMVCNRLCTLLSYPRQYATAYRNGMQPL